MKRTSLDGASEFASCVANLLFRKNFQVVSPGRCYRSGTPSLPTLRRLVQEHGVKTVVDLRQNHHLKDRVDYHEKSLLEEIGANYRHVGLNSNRRPTPETTLRLLNLFKTNEGPFLLHCTEGVHRAGFASALWLIEQGEPLEVALRQLSPRYGHFKLERRYQRWRRKRGLSEEVLSDFQEEIGQRKISFRNWVSQKLKADENFNFF